MKMVALGEVAEVRIGPFGSLLHKRDYLAGGVPLVNPMHIKGGRIVADPQHAITAEKARQLANYRMVEGDVVLGRRGEMGRCAVVRKGENGFLCGTGSLIVRPGPSLSSEYLSHLLSSPDMVTVLERSSLGTTMSNLNSKIVAAVTLPLPPFDEQRRIAAILDRADDLKTARANSITLLGSLRQSIFMEMFGTPEQLNARWDCAPLGELADTCSGGTPNRSDDSYYGGDIPWVKSGEVAQGLVLTTEETITENGVANSSAKVMPRGTVLIAMYGATAGKVGVLGIRAATNQAVCSITPGGRLTVPYLVEVLRSMNEHLLTKRSGGAQPNLSQGVIRGLTIPVPPLELQDRFCQRLREVDAAEARAFAAQDGQTELFISLQSRAFSGRL